MNPVGHVAQTETPGEEIFHFFQEPHWEQRGDRIITWLTRQEGTALCRFLARKLATTTGELLVSTPAHNASVDKPAATLHLNNVIRPEQWRTPHMVRSTSPPSRTQDLPPPEREGNLRKRFIPLAQSRTSAVIAALDYLGQLSQRARYAYTDQEISEIEEAITEKLAETMDAFRRGVGNRPGFQFRSAR